MIVLAGLLAGALAGVLTARKRGGNRADAIQYAGVFGIIGGLLGLFATIGIEKLL